MPPSGLDEDKDVTADADIEEGPVLSPDELDISDDERVMEIDDGRYVVSSGGPVTNNRSEPAGELESGSAERRDQPSNAETGPPPSEQTPNRQPEPTPQPAAGSLDARAVHDWLADDLEASGSEYAFDITANFEGNVSQQRMVSNDVVTTFETLVMWYAQQIDRNTPVEEVLGLLLMKANVPVKYPPKALKRSLKSTNLSADDTMADLLREAKSNNGLQL